MKKSFLVSGDNLVDPAKNMDKFMTNPPYNCITHPRKESRAGWEGLTRMATARRRARRAAGARPRLGAAVAPPPCRPSRQSPLPPRPLEVETKKTERQSLRFGLRKRARRVCSHAPTCSRCVGGWERASFAVAYISGRRTEDEEDGPGSELRGIFHWRKGNIGGNPGLGWELCEAYALCCKISSHLLPP